MTRLLAPLLLALGACSPYGDPAARFCFQGFESYPEQQALTVRAAAEWHNATNAGAALSFNTGICDNEDAPIFAVPGLAMDGGSSLGITAGSYEWIALNPVQEPAVFYRSALHEFGHWLTGPEHSPNPQDILYYEANELQGLHLTAADAARF